MNNNTEDELKQFIDAMTDKPIESKDADKIVSTLEKAIVDLKAGRLTALAFFSTNVASADEASPFEFSAAGHPAVVLIRIVDIARSILESLSPRDRDHWMSVIQRMLTEKSRG